MWQYPPAPARTSSTVLRLFSAQRWFPLLSQADEEDAVLDGHVFELLCPGHAMGNWSASQSMPWAAQWVREQVEFC